MRCPAGRAGRSRAETQTIAKAAPAGRGPSGLAASGSPKTRMPPAIWAALATRPIRPIVSIAPPRCRAATAAYWAAMPETTVTATSGRRSRAETPPAAGQRP